MNQRIKLTWKDDDDNIVIEDCELVKDGQEIFTMAGIIVDSEIMEKLMDSEKVIFEDVWGIFALTPDKIIDIEILV